MVGTGGSILRYRSEFWAKTRPDRVRFSRLFNRPKRRLILLSRPLKPLPKPAKPPSAVQNSKPAVQEVEAVETQSEAAEVEQPTDQVAESQESQPEPDSKTSPPPAKVSLPTPPDLGASTSHGKTESKTGDQGSEQGTLNTDALLTDPKNIPAGAQLDMPGWGWEEPPEKADQSQEQGKIIFEITIDENGEIIAVKTKFRSVSKLVANFYQAEVNKLIFVPNNPDANQEGVTKGYITFIIKAK